MKRSSISNEEFERRYEALPDEIASAFESVDTSRSILAIGKEHGLAIDTIGKVAEEVGYVMLGFVSADELVSNLAEIIGNREKAEKVASEVNQSIFSPIRESLKRMYNQDWSRGLTPVKPPPAPPPSPQQPAASTGRTAPLIERPSPVKPVESRPSEKRPEPLIIRPLPQSGRGPAAGQTPAPAKPLPPMPVQKPEPALSPKQPLPMEEKLAPTIGPLGSKPPAAEKPLIQEVNPAVAPRPEPIRIAPLQPPVKPAATPPVPPPPSQPPSPPPPPPAGAPPSYLKARESFQKELGEFREKTPAPQQAGAVPVPPASRTASGSAGGAPPLKLPQERIPRPQAPERYTSDPYREPVE